MPFLFLWFLTLRSAIRMTYGSGLDAAHKSRERQDFLLTRRCLQPGRGKVVGLGSFRQEAEGA
jgi:hypothetical protein